MTATTQRFKPHTANIGDFFISTPPAIQLMWSQLWVQTHLNGATPTLCHLAFVSNHALYFAQHHHFNPRLISTTLYNYCLKRFERSRRQLFLHQRRPIFAFGLNCDTTIPVQQPCIKKSPFVLYPAFSHRCVVGRLGKKGTKAYWG